MGLTIHYKLKAKGRESNAYQLVQALHQKARDLPFKQVGPVVDLTGCECEMEHYERDHPLRWLVIQSGGSVTIKDTHIGQGGKRGDSRIGFPAKRIIAFNAWPGEGCEESNFGLCQYPTEIFSPSRGRLRTKMSGWQWSSCCKTQYASDPACGGLQNFLCCHLTIVALLDHAKKLGLLDSVHDEGQFWEGRDVKALAEKIGEWNQFMAAVCGRVKDVAGEGVEAPITAYRNFEQLELAGQSQLPYQIEVLAQLIKQVGRT
jgi:hypothetical protein